MRPDWSCSKPSSTFSGVITSFEFKNVSSCASTALERDLISPNANKVLVISLLLAGRLLN